MPRAQGGRGAKDVDAQHQRGRRRAGDQATGKLVDWLSEHIDVIARARRPQIVIDDGTTIDRVERIEALDAPESGSWFTRWIGR